MANRIVATARRTQLVSTYGVGSLFPSMDESFMICGIDEWRVSEATEIPEPRLARSLGVDTFRAPPTGSRGGRDVPVVRFPEMHYCPGCRRLARLRDFCSWDEHRCHDCSRDLTPSRFVACCSRGHIEDFPYFMWVHGGENWAGGEPHDMTLRTRGRTSSLADIEIGCSCGVAPVSMAGSFAPTALAGVAKCKGQRPWLPQSEPQECHETLRTLQRGSSNVWFPIVRSALSIPPWSEGAHRLIARHWAVFSSAPVEVLPAIIKGMDVATEDMPVDALVQAVLERRGETSNVVPSGDDLRHEEYQALVQGRVERSPHQQFVCRSTEVDPSSRYYLAQVSEVSRLREVRALEGFTRVTPPMAGMDLSRRAALSGEQPRWLPAAEVLGEGVFLRFHEEVLAEWESTQFATRRAAAVDQGEAMRASKYGLSGNSKTAPRHLLLHSFAHMMLNELSLDAGYPAASLRERLFTAPGQAGVLIYTASADSAGSLGGLAAQSRPETIGAVLQSAVMRAAWCSSDPVCIESTSTGADAVNLAACHACLLLPETSCELMNNYLDRATMIGLPDQPDVGFFSDLLSAH